jgi:hypothetical protein
VTAHPSRLLARAGRRPLGSLTRDGGRRAGDRRADDRRARAGARARRRRVLIAALASVPAVFLTLLDGPPEIAGRVVNWVSGAVLVAETVVLAALSRDKRAWVKTHKWLLLLTALIIPAVVLAVGPVQLLRLVRVVGALRFLRARRIFRAASQLREHAGLTGWTSWVLTGGAALLIAVFVGVVLADPTSKARQYTQVALERIGGGGPWLYLALVVLAGALLGGATWVVARGRREDQR